MNKWIGISLGTLLGVSHIGMIGFVATKNKDQLPNLLDFSNILTTIAKKFIH